MKCTKCGRKIDVSEANEYYYKGEVVEAKNADLYGKPKDPMA